MILYGCSNWKLQICQKDNFYYIHVKNIIYLNKTSTFRYDSKCLNLIYCIVFLNPWMWRNMYAMWLLLLFSHICMQPYKLQQAMLLSTISWSLVKLMSTDSVMLSNHLMLCCLLFQLLSISPASASFLMNWLWASGDWIIGTSASVSVLPMNIHSWFLQDWLFLIPLLSKDPSKVFSSTQSLKASILWCSTTLYHSTLTSVHDY